MYSGRKEVLADSDLDGDSAKFPILRRINVEIFLYRCVHAGHAGFRIGGGWVTDGGQLLDV
jgi:hypothetical protein